VGIEQKQRQNKESFTFADTSFRKNRQKTTKAITLACEIEADEAAA
jgi:hypothetical protein